MVGLHRLRLGFHRFSCRQQFFGCRDTEKFLYRKEVIRLSVIPHMLKGTEMDTVGGV